MCLTFSILTCGNSNPERNLYIRFKVNRFNIYVCRLCLDAQLILPVLLPPAKPSMSSAKRRLVVVLPPVLTVPSWSSKASVMILSRNMLKRVGEINIPVGLQLLFGTSLLCCYWRGLHLWPWHGGFITRIKLALMLYFLMAAHKAAYQTLSKAILKSLKTW